MHHSYQQKVHQLDLQYFLLLLMSLFNYFEYKKVNMKKFQILTKSKLNSIKSVILKAMQESFFCWKVHTFINKKVNRNNKFKEEIRKKIKSEFSDIERKMLIDCKYKKVLMNLLKIYLVTQYMNKKMYCKKKSCLVHLLKFQDLNS